MLAQGHCLSRYHYFRYRLISAAKRTNSTNDNAVHTKKDVLVVNPLRFSDVDPQRVRSVIRSLYREATYLPDRSARVWVARQIRKGCRYNAREWDKAKVDKLIRAAKEQYSLLKRANLGTRLPLLKVLRHTYGRAGSRRHILLQKYFRPLPAYVSLGTKHIIEEKASSERTGWKSPANVNDIVSEPESEGSDNVFSLSKSYANLDCLLRSQKRALGNPSRLTLTIPKRNIWFKETPIPVVKNRIRKWYDYLLRSVQPPLPAFEWELLRAKAWGLHNEPVPVRRQMISCPTDAKAGENSKIIIQHVKDEELEDLNWLKEAGSAVLRTEVSREKLRLPERGKVGRHNITPRFLQRQLTAIFCQCPVEIWDHENHKPKFKWGKPKPKFLHLQEST